MQLRRVYVARFSSGGPGNPRGPSCQGDCGPRRGSRCSVTCDPRERRCWWKLRAGTLLPGGGPRHPLRGTRRETEDSPQAGPAAPPPKIIGCQVRREPPDSTERYTRWINQLAPEQLLTQVFTSHGPTVVMPTWFCSRAWFSHVGPFDEGGQGVPEDLLLFYNHLRKGGGVVRVDRSLVLYRYHPDAATHSVLETTIWTHRVRFLEERVLPHWAAFTIWNAGRQGRRLYRSLSAGAQRKVVAFCDVDENKIRKGFYCYEDSKEAPKPRVPILHFRAARPPFVICVKLDLTGGEFEANLRSLNLQEGRDFLHFS
ncbi:UDP-GlcNAc:betaGal beta-1,3-N-acetylglucosaminyltransferase-like protein 1 isoform X3 [Vulpes lagopus]|uniref:UDP-GlcNAc:betaGal beta-1,3-N-acetylglucosaminyltransferase-like protein 1 isoform X3 n=1 Tax=Vulpes lagopus TaxID=494514 RepID=UPI001BC8F284|nr:UDP-GlcNAc:betaGal beta-1,3-N-acetylglucosaminyltransferase-like protein 1 isoform X3 [Vulpes lagopus]